MKFDEDEFERVMRGSKSMSMRDRQEVIDSFCWDTVIAQHDAPNMNISNRLSHIRDRLLLAYHEAVAS